MGGAKHYVFTLNNWDDNGVTQLCAVAESDAVSFLMFQKEIAPDTGTPHLQGFISLSKKKEITWLKKHVSDKAHFAVAKGTPMENYVYCSKLDSRANPDELPFESGILPQGPGKRTDLQDFKEACKEGGMTMKRAREEFSDIAAKYPRFVKDYIDDLTPLPPVQAHPYRDWQAGLDARLALVPDDRKVIFVVDYEGNLGKTWFAKQYCRNHDDAQYMEPGKKADMAYAIEVGKRVLFINVARQQVEHLQFNFIESVKDGMVFSPKYESGMKYLTPMHVVVMMNQDPDRSKMSHDRYEEWNISDNGFVCPVAPNVTPSASMAPGFILPDI